MEQDPYCYPGTTVLRNKENIRDADQLKATERLLSGIRLNELPFDMAMTTAGYRKLHRHIFQDVYEWAGRDRTVNIRRTGIWFAFPQFIDTSLNARFALLKAENNLRGVDAVVFASRAADHCGDLNSIHPFREGNGRTLRAFLERLAEQAGHPIDLTRIDPAFWNHASRVSHERGDNSLLAAAITGAMAPPGYGQAIDGGVDL